MYTIIDEEELVPFHSLIKFIIYDCKAWQHAREALYDHCNKNEALDAIDDSFGSLIVYHISSAVGHLSSEDKEKMMTIVHKGYNNDTISEIRSAVLVIYRRTLTRLSDKCNEVREWIDNELENTPECDEEE